MALITSLLCNKSPDDVIQSLCTNVVRDDGTKASQEELVRQAVKFVEQTDKKGTLATKLLLQSAKVFQELAVRTGMDESDVLGQILWRYRKAQALQAKPLQKAVMDLSWLDVVAERLPIGIEKPTELIDSVFRNNTTKGHRRLYVREFQKVMERTFENYHGLEGDVIVYRGSTGCLRRTDWDRLFHAQENQSGQRGITLRGFHTVLLQLADCMDVHPCCVFLTVGRTCGNALTHPQECHDL